MNPRPKPPSEPFLHTLRCFFSMLSWSTEAPTDPRRTDPFRRLPTRSRSEDRSLSGSAPASRWQGSRDSSPRCRCDPVRSARRPALREGQGLRRAGREGRLDGVPHPTDKVGDSSKVALDNAARAPRRAGNCWAGPVEAMSPPCPYLERVDNVRVNRCVHREKCSIDPSTASRAALTYTYSISVQPCG